MPWLCCVCRDPNNLLLIWLFCLPILHPYFNQYTHAVSHSSRLVYCKTKYKIPLWLYVIFQIWHCHGKTTGTSVFFFRAMLSLSCHSGGAIGVAREAQAYFTSRLKCQPPSGEDMIHPNVSTQLLSIHPLDLFFALNRCCLYNICNLSGACNKNNFPLGLFKYFWFWFWFWSNACWNISV